MHRNVSLERRNILIIHIGAINYKGLRPYLGAMEIPAHTLLCVRARVMSLSVLKAPLLLSPCAPPECTYAQIEFTYTSSVQGRGHLSIAAQSIARKWDSKQGVHLAPPMQILLDQTHQQHHVFIINTQQQRAAEPISALGNNSELHIERGCARFWIDSLSETRREQVVNGHLH